MRIGSGSQVTFQVGFQIVGIHICNFLNNYWTYVLIIKTLNRFFLKLANTFLFTIAWISVFCNRAHLVKVSLFPSPKYFIFESQRGKHALFLHVIYFFPYSKLASKTIFVRVFFIIFRSFGPVLKNKNEFRRDKTCCLNRWKCLLPYNIFCLITYVTDGYVTVAFVWVLFILIQLCLHGLQS